MNEQALILKEKREGVLHVTFNNPAVLNALTPAFLKAYGELLSEIEGDDSIDVVILTGTGKAFIAGADIKYMLGLSPMEAAKSADATDQLYRRMEAMDKIFIAAVNGFALGGGAETLLACDLRVAAANAKFGFPEVGLGVIPGGGGTQRLPRIVGPGKAKELIFTGKIIDAAEAERIGLVNQVVEAEALKDAVDKLAGDILKNSRVAVKAAKAAVNQGTQGNLALGAELERKLFGLCFSEPDQKEGMSAFVEKRPPEYRK